MIFQSPLFLCQWYLFQNHLYQIFISSRYLEFPLYTEFLKNLLSNLMNSDSHIYTFCGISFLGVKSSWSSKSQPRVFFTCNRRIGHAWRSSMILMHSGVWSVILKHITLHCKTESPVYSLKTENTTSFEEFVNYLQKASILKRQMKNWQCSKIKKVI